MATATINGHVVAESDEFEIVEGNVYFPPASVKEELFTEIDLRTTCPWKGEASYYDIVVGGERFAGKAWFYPEPKDAAENIRGYVAFYVPPVEVVQ